MIKHGSSELFSTRKNKRQNKEIAAEDEMYNRNKEFQYRETSEKRQRSKVELLYTRSRTVRKN